MDAEARSIGVPVGALVTLALSLILVGLRGALGEEVIALVLAFVVVFVARATGPAGGLGAAAVAAASFNFFFTKPYQLLKIDGLRGVAVPVCFVALAGAASWSSWWARRIERARRSENMDLAAVSRLLDVAGRRSVEDVQTAVRIELLTLLSLIDCTFTRAETNLPELGETGYLPGHRFIYTRDGMQLPPDGLAVPVVAVGERVGTLVCTPFPGVGVDLARRRTAVAAARVLGLALVAGSDTNRREANG